MAWVSIQEASRRLNVSQDMVRRNIREGGLKAKRQPNSSGGTSWCVELPDEGWEDDFRHHSHSITQQVTPWWFPSKAQEGLVQYIESLGIEEVAPLFLSGLTSEDIWPAVGHDPNNRCPDVWRRSLTRV